MRILHVITSLQTGGAEKLMLDLIPRLNAAGQEADLLLFDGTYTPFRRQAESIGINVMDLGKGGSVYSPIKIYKLLKYLKRYEIVHTHNTSPQLFAAIASLLCSVVLCTTEHNTSNRRRSWKWYASIDRWMYNRYKQVICISDMTEKKLISYIDRTKSSIITINNGIDVEKYSNAQSAIIKSTVEGCEFALMQIAGFRYQKDQKTVIKALKYLPKSVHLFLIGDGEKRIDLENLVTTERLRTRVHFMGVRTDVPQLLKSADFVVMSSHWEGFGLAAVEGMAAGKPVIASDVPGLKEVVSGAGLLFHHGDSKALAMIIEKLITDKEYRDKISRKCISRAMQFDISKMVDGYLKVYENLKPYIRK